MRAKGVRERGARRKGGKRDRNEAKRWLEGGKNSRLGRKRMNGTTTKKGLGGKSGG